MNQNGNDNNAGDNDQVPPNRPHEPRLLQDLEHFIQANGIQQQSDSQQEQHNASEQERLRNEASYQKEMYKKFFPDTKSEEENKVQERMKCIESNQTQFLTIKAADGIVEGVRLTDLVKECDVIHALVSSEEWINRRGKNENGMEFSLEQFSSASTRSFLSLLHSLSRQTTTGTDNDDNNRMVKDIESEHIVECCQIAHFLQCTLVLNETAEIIRSSIDIDNCIFIYTLADQLQLQALSASAMEFVLDKLDDIQNHDIWDDLPSNLKRQVQTLHNAAKSSLVSGGGGGRGGGQLSSKKVLFSSSDEFIAIFSDTIREQKERLQDAKLRQKEIIEERMRMNEQRGRYYRDVDVMGGDVQDAAIKIEKQEKRIMTLEAFYEDQKKIFKEDANDEGIYKGSFTL